MELKFELSIFLPADAARMTGVSPDLQRSYRRRGYLPSHGGRDARHDVFSLATMFLVRSMAANVAPFVVSAIVRRALENPAAWAPHPGMNAAALAADVMREYCPDKPLVRLARYFVIFPGSGQTETGSFYESLDAAFAHEAASAFGPVLVIDTQNAADAMVARAGRPLVRVCDDPIAFEQFSRPVRALAH